MSIVLSTGVDIAEIDRVRMLKPSIRQRFIRRILAPVELERPHLTDETVVGLFCAKEAVSKALGCGIGLISWHEIIILPDELSAPRLHLSGRAAQIAQDQSITNWSVSISHSTHYAVAMAIGYGER